LAGGRRQHPSISRPAQPCECRDDTVFFTCPNASPGDPHGSTAYCVWIGGLTAQSVRFVEPFVDDGWEFYSGRDA
jgi:hypothetical protein